MNTDKGREGHGASCPAGRGRRAEEGPCSTVACFYVLTSVLFQHSNIFIGRILLMFYTIILIPKLKGYKTVYGQDFNFQVSKQKPHRDRLIISRKRKKANMTKQNTLNLGGRIQVFIVLVFWFLCIFNIFHNIKMELKTRQIHTSLDTHSFAAQADFSRCGSKACGALSCNYGQKALAVCLHRFAKQVSLAPVASVLRSLQMRQCGLTGVVSRSLPSFSGGTVRARACWGAAIPPFLSLGRQIAHG